MTSKRSWVIYGLRESETLPVRYVGATTNTHNRILQHLSRARNGSVYPVYEWIRTLASAPILTVLEVVSDGDWQGAERRWINDLPDLLNVALGGYDYAVSSESRKRAGEKNQGRVCAPETKARISAAKTGCKRPDNAARNRRLSASRIGVRLVISDEERERRRVSLKAASANLTPWSELPEEVREARRRSASEQMRRVWAQRKMEAA